MSNYPFTITATGRKYHYGKFDPDELHLDDIARALSRMCRFAGHLSDKYEDDIYSVAQHSVYVWKWLVKYGADESVQKWGATHDAPEGYWQDMISPIKGIIPAYDVNEKYVQEQFRTVFNIPFNDTIEFLVNSADWNMFLAEAIELGAQNETYYSAEGVENTDPIYTIHQIDPDFYPWRPKKARDEYLAMCEELNIRRN